MAYNAGASSGNLVLISKQTASASASLTFTGIGSTYDILKLVMYGVTCSANNQSLLLQISYDNGATYKSDANYNLSRAVSNNTAPAFANFTGLTGFYCMDAIDDDANGQACGEATLYNVTSNTKYPLMISVGGQVLGIAESWNLCSSYVGSLGAVNAFKLIPTAGNIATGTFKLYGVQN